MSESIRLSRSDLYELVWSSPATEIAKKYLVSDVGLAKLCRRLRVPKPARGYWASGKKAKRAKRLPLPEPVAGMQSEVVLQTRSISTSEPRPARPEPIVMVPNRLASPHPLISRTAAVLKSARAESDGRVASWGEGVLSITVSPERLARALLLVDTLIKELDRRGHRVEVISEHKRVTVVVIDGERVEFSLRERLLQTERPQGARGSSLWSSKYDYRPSGHFTFAIHGMYTRDRQTWSDGLWRRIEDKLGSVVLGLEDAARTAREERLRREEERRRAEEERRRAAEERARQEAEAKRVEELRDQAIFWEEADRIRRYLAAVEQRVREGAGDHRTKDWIAWAKGVADHLDPIGPR